MGMRRAKSVDRVHGIALIATESEWSTIVNALRTAAGSYSETAHLFEECGNERMAEQFERQASEALALADKIAEEAGV